MSRGDEMISVPRKKLLQMADEIYNDHERVEFLADIGALDEEVDYRFTLSVEFRIDHGKVSVKPQVVVDQMIDHLARFTNQAASIQSINTEEEVEVWE